MINTCRLISLLIFGVLFSCNQYEIKKDNSTTGSSGEQDKKNGLTYDTAFPQYWQYKGKTVLLLGGSVEDNLFQLPDLEEHLDKLQAAGGNYVRCTMSARDSGNVWPFGKDPETGLYDLKTWNEAYWKRVDNFLQLTSERDIIAQIEVWATFDFYRDNWDVNPFNPKNNKNYGTPRTKIPHQVNSHPTWCENPFFWSVPTHDNNLPVLQYQQAFVDKLLSFTLQYDNILYCMDNETSVTSEWGKFWSTYIKKRAKEQNKLVQTTEMWDPHNLNHITHRESFDHPENYSFVEISQNNHQYGQNHWDNGLKQIQRLKDNSCLRPVTSIKVYGCDRGRHGHGTDNGIASFIRNVFFGTSAVRFHRPNSGLGLSDTAQAVIKSIRELTDQMEFFHAAPHNDLLSNRDKNEAYCRANPGKEYAVYFPENGEIDIDVSAVSGKIQVQWLDILNNNWKDSQLIEAGNKLSLKSHGEKHWAVLILPVK